MISDRFDFTHLPDLKVDDVIKQVETYQKDFDRELMRECYLFAENAHSKQKRSSGEPYIIHPLNVAYTLSRLKMDVDSIMAGFLHDVVEDCDVSAELLKEKFGTNVAQIVVGCTKISKIKFKSKQESQAENFRKMIVAMAKDIRVIIVKLADRMHNMRTLQYMAKEKQVQKAQETLDIYVPLASRLGIHSVKSELEDLCLRFIHPESYYRLAEKVAMKKTDRDEYIRSTVDSIIGYLNEYSIKAEISGRSKHFYSIYKKMQMRGVDFDQIQDLLAFRVIVGNITECYKTLGVIHSHFTPVPGRFKDYIAMPKANDYQSLHTTVIGPRAERIEIQIRTFEMHEIAETGVAAHWKYKERDKKKNDDKLKWVHDLLEMNQNLDNNSEFMNIITSDLDAGGIFVFTPNGDVLELRHGSTPLDFAYAVHTEVGHRAVGAKINGKMVGLRYRLKSGDSIEILTNKSQEPNKDWLKIVKSSRAKTKIRQYLLKVEREKQRKVGEQALEEALKSYGTSIKALTKKNEFHKVFDELHAKNLDELFIHLGSKRHHVNEVLKKIPSVDFQESEETKKKIDSLYQKLEKTAKKASNKENAVVVDGLDDIVVRMGKCCNPIPGDPIVGCITRGRGITVHTANCHHIIDSKELRNVDVEWNSNYSFKHPVNIYVITHDRPGILARVSKNINNIGVNIRSALAKSLPDQKGSFVFEVEVRDFSEYLKVVSVVEGMDEVISVRRA